MKKKILLVAIVIILILFASFFIYTSIYYKADDVAISTLEADGKYVGDNIVFEGIDNEIGFIIYPGAKVEAEAYSTLASKLQSNGFTTAIVDFPLRIAFFDSNAADEIIDKYDDIEKWVIIGHSLGGAVASNYIEKNAGKVAGISYLASYPISDVNIEAIYIYGSNDLVLNKSNIPKSDNIKIINGGNHAGFANYGPQKGDGDLEISRDMQIELTTQYIINFYTVDNISISN